MIFVTVGNASQPFRRLLDGVEILLEQEVITDPVVMQTGRSGFESSIAVVHQRLPYDEFIEHVRRAEVVVCHAGAGTLIHVLESGKVPVVMPRLSRYGEHVDDHQLELASAFEADGRIVVAAEPAELAEAIAKARRLTRGAEPVRSDNRMVQLVRQALEELG